MSQNNKPLSSHWADIAAHKVILEHGDKEIYTVASGITPSGTVHVGNFREVVTVDLVAKALIKRGKKVRFIYSWDNFDTFRKVPSNLPKPEDYKDLLRKPIARIPDPWKNESSYARGREVCFENELCSVGIKPEYIYQEKQYSSGKYANEIKFILDNLDKVKEVLNRFRTTPLKDDWLPTAIYCSNCEKDDMTWQRYDNEWGYSYQCANCKHSETIDIRKTSNLKLNWRLDWPMRWHYENVDFEPGGKDHSSDGGSYDTAKQLIKAIWDKKPPTYQQYDFVMIKGGTGKMSSSKGELFTVKQVLEVFEPQILRWIFATQKPNHDFSLAFDEDVIKVYDEFDKAEQAALGDGREKVSRWQTIRRSYELSLLDDNVPKTPPKRARFRTLCDRLQIVDQDINRCFERFYKKDLGEENYPYFILRAKKALNWLKLHAPKNYCYSIVQSPLTKNLDEKDTQIIIALKNMLKEIEIEELTDKELNQLVWDKVIKGTNSESKHTFGVIYNALIQRSQGPRLANFLKEIGKERLLKLL